MRKNKAKHGKDLCWRKFYFWKWEFYKIVLVLTRQIKNIYKLEDNKSLVSKFIKGLDYDLTKAQKRVIKEIYSELKAGKIVNRLIQGDVGSGKTIVSFIMLLYMVEK